MSNRESAARAIREIAVAIRAAARPWDHDGALALCDYMTSFADAHETAPPLAFDVEFGQTVKWEGDQLIQISAFWDAHSQGRQIGLL